MKSLFADTSFYLAVLNPRDVAHAKASQVGEHHGSVRREGGRENRRERTGLCLIVWVVRSIMKAH
jgi:hypothetical protein